MARDDPLVDSHLGQAIPELRDPVVSRPRRDFFRRALFEPILYECLRMSLSSADFFLTAVCYGVRYVPEREPPVR